MTDRDELVCVEWFVSRSLRRAAADEQLRGLPMAAADHAHEAAGHHLHAALFGKLSEVGYLVETDPAGALTVRAGCVPTPTNLAADIKRILAGVRETPKDILERARSGLLPNDVRLQEQPPFGSAPGAEPTHTDPGAGHRHPDGAAMPVRALLESLPGIDKGRTHKILTELKISESRRVRGLGIQQRERLLERFTAQGRPAATPP
ncbi:hypothetical protein [Streptomyces sp. NBC_01538]|uniref:hypothetical protein n=1 Tax=Streptomyces sp. NBC_01538 TaxID=2903897 RepID=UPI003866EFA0